VGNSQWLVQLLERLGHKVRIGHAAQIRASYVRKQKTDKRDACHILKLLVEDRFPCIWVPDARMRDQRQMLIHRHKLVQIRRRVKNEVQHLMMNQGLQKKHKLWSARYVLARISLSVVIVRPLKAWPSWPLLPTVMGIEVILIVAASFALASDSAHGVEIFVISVSPALGLQNGALRQRESTAIRIAPPLRLGNGADGICSHVYSTHKLLTHR
jgi:hypothetical protein